MIKFYIQELRSNKYYNEPNFVFDIEQVKLYDSYIEAEIIVNKLIYDNKISGMFQINKTYIN